MRDDFLSALDPTLVEEEVLDRMTGERSYYVDFSSWSVKASSREEALRLAKQRLTNGEVPEIDDVSEE